MEPEEYLLVVDDNRDLLETLQLTLELAGYQTFVTTDAQVALSHLQSRHVDLIISDIAMPGMNGYQFFQRVRANPAWVQIPFLFLTARGLDSDVRFGKELGVDDYLMKPIQPDDLLAAVRGRLARARQLRSATAAVAAPTALADGGQRLEAGRIAIDPERHRAWLDEQPLQLGQREFQILELLVRRPDRIVTSRELVQTTHGFEVSEHEASNLLRPLIRSLRRKLGYGVGEMGCIENVRGLGYRLIV